MKLPKHIFWDVEPTAINLDEHKRFVIQRFLERGSLEQFQQVITFYGKDIVKQECLQIRNMDKKTLSFLSLIFNVPKEKFRCYTSIQFQLT